MIISTFPQALVFKMFPFTTLVEVFCLYILNNIFLVFYFKLQFLMEKKANCFCILSYNKCKFLYLSTVASALGHIIIYCKSLPYALMGG